jgi:predicted DNA-binding transcriptional regulator YafY
MRRAVRLFQIVQQLRARRLTTAQHLADRLEISPRTVYRDIRDLSLAGIPVRGEAGVGYSLAPGFNLTPLMFTPDEVEAVVAGIRMVAAYGGPELRFAGESALQKVALALPKERREEPDTARIFAPRIRPDGVADARLDQIRHAVAGCRKVSIAYSDRENRTTTRTLRPLGLYFWGSKWTFVAWCEVRNDFRSFRIDRIARIEILPDTFQAEAGKRLEDFIATLPECGNGEAVKLL